MEIKLLGGKLVEIEDCGFSINLKFRDIFIDQENFVFHELYYDDLIKLATALLKKAEELK